MFIRLEKAALWGVLLVGMIFVAALSAGAAPYAAMVMDARTGEVLHARNADARLHPASLTKMMTLYVVFDAIERGEISLDTTVKISKKAAAEQPSKLGLTAGSRIKLRYLVRAAAVKSANDAATALAEAVSGSEAAFARRMNRTAKALGMTRSTFKNAHGLTEKGHLSTARDMTLLGRRLFYDHPSYYNLFSRRSTNAGIRDVSNTNRRFLAAYKGADGIKTGYTRAAGFNLVASAERGNERIIATMFGGRSTAQRNAKVAELLDLGFRRAPSNVAVKKPTKPNIGPAPTAGRAGKTIRLTGAVKTSPFPIPRPDNQAEPTPEMLVAMAETIEQAVTAAQVDPIVQRATEPITASSPPVPAIKPVAKPATEGTVIATLANPAPTDVAAPKPRPAQATLASTSPDPDSQPERIVVARLSTSGGRLWGINVGRFNTRYQAERILLKTALTELGTLDTALRKVASSSSGHDANFVGMTQEGATRACSRLLARNIKCSTIEPGQG